MNPTIEVYYDPSRLPLPPVVDWLDDLGIAATHRTPQEAPQEWLQRYGCCFPWVVADGRMVLKAGFQRVHLERLVQRWFGTALVVWWRIPKSEPQECGETSQSQRDAASDELSISNRATPSPRLKPRIHFWECDINQLPDNLLAQFRLGWHPIILWSSDESSPDESHVEAALLELKSHDVVAVHDRQGRVVLLGLRSWHGALFEDSGLVSSGLAKWVNRARTLNLQIAELDLSSDSGSSGRASTDKSVSVSEAKERR
jgi:hypothetical protein